MISDKEGNDFYKVWDQSILWTPFMKDRYRNLDIVVDAGVDTVTIKLNPMEASFESVISEIDDFKKTFKNDDVKIRFSLADASLTGKGLDDYRLLKVKGVSSVLLACEANNYGYGCWDSIDHGLTPSGIKWIEDMENLGIIIDGSLGGHRTTMEAMEHSSKPFIFSHTNPHGVCGNRRNIRDDQLKKMASKGGVAGLTFLGGYHGEEIMDSEAMFRNIDYCVNLIGVEHVAIGSNYLVDTDCFWKALSEVKMENELGKGDSYQHIELPKLIDLMRRNGYDRKDIQNIFYDNWSRIFE